MGALKFIAICHRYLNGRSKHQDIVQRGSSFVANECVGAARVNEDEQFLILDYVVELDSFLAWNADCC